MRISVFGTGYVGLVAAACFADKGNDVVCVDVDEKKIAMLRQGKSPIYEPGLAELLEHNKKRLTFTADAKQGVLGIEVIFMAVGTPQKQGSHDADLQYLEAASIKIAGLMEAAKIIVIKSTVPVGTATHIRELMSKHTKHQVTIVSNPEFLKEGDAIRDFEFPDRVVIGTKDERARLLLHDLYEPFFRRSERLILMDNQSAELTKYGSNIMLAARISVMNELARLADATGADISLVRQGVGADSRIGTAFLYPSPGYGGSCFPKDVREATALSERLGVHIDIIPAIDSANEMQKRFFSDKVLKILGSAKAKRIAIWGAAFKQKTDDVRESPTITMVNTLLDAGAEVTLFDPEAMENIRKLFGEKIEYCEQYECLENADALVIMTDWNEFKNPDFQRMKQLLKKPVIIDGRNLYSLERMRMEGFQYSGIGRRI